jgi:hypothetical protein
VHKGPVGIKGSLGCCTNYIQPHPSISCWSLRSFIVTFPTNIQQILRYSAAKSIQIHRVLHPKLVHTCKAPEQRYPVRFLERRPYSAGSADCIYPSGYESGIANKQSKFGRLQVAQKLRSKYKLINNRLQDNLFPYLVSSRIKLPRIASDCPTTYRNYGTPINSRYRVDHSRDRCRH